MRDHENDKIEDFEDKNREENYLDPDVPQGVPDDVVDVAPERLPMPL